MSPFQNRKACDRNEDESRCRPLNTTENASENSPLGRRTFTWRSDSYRLDTGTWYFWGEARLIQLPVENAEFRMAPDTALFIKFAVGAGCEPNTEVEGADLVEACQAYLIHNGYQVWTAREALQLVRDDQETELAERLMDRLIHWFFVAPF